MAGGVRDTSATFETKVNGLGQLRDLDSAFNKAIESARRLDGVLGNIGHGTGSNNQAMKMAEGYEKAARAAQKLAEITGRGGSNRGAEDASKITEAYAKAAREAQKFTEAANKGTSGKAAESVNKLSEGYQKASSEANKLAESSGKTVEGAAKEAAAVAKIAESYSKVDVASSRASQQQTRLSEYQAKAEQATIKAASAQDKETAALQKSVAQAEKLASAREKDAAMARKYDAQTNAINQRSSTAMAREQKFNGGSRIGGALKDAASMFAPGMLLAGGVMSAANGVKELFKSGWDNIKQTSAASAQWRTYTGSAVQGNVQANRLQKTALQYGQDFGLVNESARQIYMGLEGGNKVGRTNKLTKDVLKGIDAEGMSSFDAERFTKYAIGNAFDTGKVNKMALKEMSNYAPQMKDAWVKSLKADGQNVKNYADVQKLAHEGKLTAEDLEKALNYAGSHEWKDASKNLLQTIPGMLRVMKTGSAQFMGQFESSFMKPLGKALQPFALKMSKWFTSGQADKTAAKLGSSMAGISAKAVSGLSKVAGVLGSLWKSTAPFRSAFSKGFGTAAKDIGSIVKTIGGIGSKLKNLIPKGATKNFEKIQSKVGDVTGKFTAAALALKAIGSGVGGIKGVAKAASTFASKLPMIGKLFKNTKQDTAAGKMMKAADTMQSAANTMSKTSTGDAFGNDGLGGNKETRVGRNSEKYGKKSWFGRIADKGEAMIGMEGGRVAAKTPAWKKFVGKGLSLFGRSGDKALGGFSKFGGRLLGGRLGNVIGGLGKGAKFLGKGMPGLNALFAGFDLMDTNANTKAGTKARRVGYGNAIGGGVGATAGGALGSLLDPFIGPLGTIGGGMIGNWVGNKVGSFIGGLNFKKIGSNIGNFMKPIQGAMSKTGSLLTKLPGGDLLGNFMKFEAHPIKGIQNAFGDVKGVFSKLGSFKMPDISKMFKGIGSGVMDKLKNPFKGWKIPKLSLPKFKLPKLSNPFKDWKLPKIKMPNLKLPKLSNPFKGWKIPKLKMPNLHLPKLTNPFKNWKLPKIKMPDLHLPKLSNPFKNWKIPSLKMPSLHLPKMDNPFKGWKIPKLKVPDLKLPKLSNPFKNWKIPKLEMPSWMKDIGNFFKPQAAKASTKSSSKSSGSSKSSKGSATVKVSSSSLKSIQSQLSKLKNKNISIKVKTSGDASIKKLQSSFKSLKNKSVSVKVKATGQNAIKTITNSFKKLKNKSVNVRTKVSGAGSIKTVSNNLKKLKSKSISVRAKVSGSGPIRTLSNNLKRLKSKSVSVRVRATGAPAVKSLQSTINRLRSKSVSARAKVSGTSSVRSLSNAINRVRSKTVTARANVSGKGEVTSLRSAISSLKGKTVKVAASVSGTSAVRSLASAINAVHSKSVTITANVAGKGASRLATGTPGAKGAFASYAGGTSTRGGHPGGMALVNDAKGSHFREAFMLPDGTVGLFPKIRNLLTMLPRGAQVLDAISTRRKFGVNVDSYANGTEGASAAIDALTSKTDSVSGAKSGNKRITFAPVVKFGDIVINGSADAGAAKNLMNTLEPMIQESLENMFRNLLAKNSEELA